MFMPSVFKHNGFRYFFYSNEGNPRESIHIHVIKGDGEAKFWLEPEVVLVRSKGFDARILRRLAKVVTERRQEIKGAWHEYYG